MFFMFRYFVFFLLLTSYGISAQDDFKTEGLYDDPSVETQRSFVKEILSVAGYVPEYIQIYQTLPNYAHVYRIKLDSVTGGFMFVRWNKEKKEHYIANKMIDPGLYYSLKAAREIMRKQTRDASFSVEEAALQASDQEQIEKSDLIELRLIYDKKKEEKEKLINEVKSKDQQKHKPKLNKKRN